MNKKHLTLIAYDISDNRRRAKLLKILKRWRLDGQKSVHECLLSKQQAHQLYTEIKDQADPETDRILLIQVDSHRPLYHRGQSNNVGQLDNLFYIK